MGLKLNILSDTHTQEYTLNPEADLIIHLGDTGNGSIKHILEFVNKCKAINKPYIFIPGNHEAQGWSIEGLYDWLDSQNINYLTDGMEFKFQDYTFVGGTLFTNYQLYSTDPIEVDNYKATALDSIDDFTRISYQGRAITPSDYVTMFNKQYNWINQYRGKEKVIVLTHFLPSKACIDPFYLNHPTNWILNPYFANNLDLTGFKYWIFGHTHTSVFKVDNGCQLICNPHGYPKELARNGYVPNLIIEIE